MPVAVSVRVAVKFAWGVGVTMSVYQIRAEKQGVIVHNLRGSARSDNPAPLENMA